MITIEPTTVAALQPVLAPAGLDARALDAAHLRWVLRLRMNAASVREAADYVRLLQESLQEREALTEALLVQETRFFRDPAVFALLQEPLQQMAASSAGTLRFASAPCSTGQEAYSLAAAAVAAGIELQRFTIDAFDLSASALAIAERGEYTARSAEHLSVEQRLSLGSEREGALTVHPELRERVCFERRNLTEQNALGTEARYDVILCRNLFIYLHAEARRALAASLACALLPTGRLVLGSGDHVAEVSAIFSPLQPAASFAFATGGPQAETAAPNVLRTRLQRVNPARKQQPRSRLAHATDSLAALSLAAPAELSAGELVKRALQARAAGNLRLTERRCRQALYVDPDCLPAMELLDSVWHSTASVRLRTALSARIHRMRVIAATQHSDGGRS